MKFNQELIQKLRNGEVAIDKNQNIELVKAVLKEAFPRDGHRFDRTTYASNGGCKIAVLKYNLYGYYNEKTYPKQYNLPTHSIEDFIEVEQKEQKQYMVIVRINGNYPALFDYYDNYIDAEKFANEKLLSTAESITSNETATAEIVSIEKTLTATKTITIS